MRCVLVLFAFSAASLLPTNVTAHFPLAIGGHGSAFFNGTSSPLVGWRIWVEVWDWRGWTNASFANASEIRVDNKGNYELEAIVGDARRRLSIHGIRLYLEGSQGVMCWHRDVDLEYMYLYQPGRKPSRPFNYDIMMFDPNPHGEATGLQPGASIDECFHPSLSIDLLGLIMCNASVPVANATVFVVANRTSDGPLVMNAGKTDSKGHYQNTVIFEADTHPKEIRHVLLMFANACDKTKPPTNFTACTIPLDFLHSYEEEYQGRDFRFRILADTNERLCDKVEDRPQSA